MNLPRFVPPEGKDSGGGRSNFLVGRSQKLITKMNKNYVCQSLICSIDWPDHTLN
jgi:hypothetical protein